MKYSAFWLFHGESNRNFCVSGATGLNSYVKFILGVAYLTASETDLTKGFFFFTEVPVMDNAGPLAACFKISCVGSKDICVICFFGISENIFMCQA